VIEIFGPGWGNYALRGIVEVEAPERVSLVPSTPGWWALGAVALLLAVRFAYRRYRRWQGNRYRREAIARLAALRRRIEAGDSAALRELAPLLRATALEVLPRAQVAAATGRTWQDALANLAPELPALPLDQLHRFAYGPPTALCCAEAREILPLLERWIAQHRGPCD
jgi:hypothetical protein